MRYFTVLIIGTSRFRYWLGTGRSVCVPDVVGLVADWHPISRNTIRIMKHRTFFTGLTSFLVEVMLLIHNCQSQLFSFLFDLFQNIRIRILIEHIRILVNIPEYSLSTGKFFELGQEFR